MTFELIAAIWFFGLIFALSCLCRLTAARNRDADLGTIGLCGILFSLGGAIATVFCAL